jgi:acyl-CoA thioesterase I
MNGDMRISTYKWLEKCAALCLQLRLRNVLCVTILGAASVMAVSAVPPKVLVLGDSLSAEYGLARGAGWVALMEQRLAQEKTDATVTNASISGETTSGGLARLPALLLTHQPNILIIELGGNDALRGMAMKQTEKNLTQMIALAQKAGAKVLLLGMQVPPNMGIQYAAEFASVYTRCVQNAAKTTKVTLVPFFLKNIADVPHARELFQPDGIHPVARAHPVMLLNMYPELKRLLK